MLEFLCIKKYEGINKEFISDLKMRVYYQKEIVIHFEDVFLLKGLCTNICVFLKSILIDMKQRERKVLKDKYFINCFYDVSSSDVKGVNYFRKSFFTLKGIRNQVIDILNIICEENILFKLSFNLRRYYNLSFKENISILEKWDNIRKNKYSLFQKVIEKIFWNEWIRKIHGYFICTRILFQQKTAVELLS